MKSQHIRSSGGYFKAEFIHKYHDGGNADQSLLALTINQLGKVEVDETKGIITIDFYGAMEVEEFVAFCRQVAEKNPL